MVDLPKSVSRGSPGDANVLLRCCQVAPTHERLEWNRRHPLVGVVAGSRRTETMRIDPAINVCCLGGICHSSIDSSTGSGERFVLVSESLQTQLQPERQINGDRPGGGNRLRVPASFHRFFLCEFLIVSRLLCCLPTTIAALAGFVLWNAKQHPIPIEPLCSEVRDLASPESESASSQTHEPRLQVMRFWQRTTRFQEEFKLSVRKYILVGVPRSQGLSMLLCPFIRLMIVIRHPPQECCAPELKGGTSVTSQQSAR